MKAILIPILSLLVLGGCASPAPTPDALMRLPPNEVFEVRHSAPVPAAIAYRNIIERAQQCWRREDRTIDAESFNSKAGVARLSVKRPAGTLNPPLTLVVVEVSRESDASTRLTGRSLVATAERKRDLQNLPLWAEGKKPTCGG
jgi:hypothetical protein